MAAIGTASLLFAFGGLAGPAGNYAFDAIRAAPPRPARCRTRPRRRHFRRRIEGRHRTFARLVATRPSGSSQPCLRPDERRHDQGRDLRIRPHRLRPAGNACLVVGPALPLLGASTAVLGLLYAVLDNDFKRVLAYSTVENIGIIFVGLGLGAGLQSLRACAAAAVAPWRQRSCTASIIPGSSRCSSSAQARCCTPQAGAISMGLAA